MAVSSRRRIAGSFGGEVRPCHGDRVEDVQVDELACAEARIETDG